MVGEKKLSSRILSALTALLMVVSAVVTLSIMAGSNTISANAAARDWTVGCDVAKYASDYEIAEAYLLVKSGLKSTDESVFNPDIYHYADYYMTSNGLFTKVDSIKYEIHSGSITNPATLAILETTIKENYKKGYYICGARYVATTTNDKYYHVAFAVENVQSDGTIDIYSPNQLLPSLIKLPNIYPLSALGLSNAEHNYTVEITIYKKQDTGTTTTTTTPPATPTYTLITGKKFIKNNSTGTYLNVAGGKDANATNVGLAANTGSNAFIMNMTAVKSGDASKGTYIMPACSSTRVINPYADTIKSGTNVNIYTKNTDGTQYWLWEKVSGGYVIRNNQNKNLVLTADGTNVCVKTYSGAKTQIWSLENAFTAKEISGNYYLKNKGTGTYAYAAGKTSTSNVALGAKKENTSFQMAITPVTKGSPVKGCLITPKVGSLVLNPYSDTPANGTNVNLYAKSGDGTQYWIFEPVSGGYIIHNNYNKNLVLNGNGTNVNIATKSSSNNQIWVLEAVTTTTTTTKAVTTTTTTTTTTTAETTSTTEETTSTGTETNPAAFLGDATLDGEISVSDIVVVLQYSVNKAKYSLDTDALANSDVNADGDVNSYDAFIIQQVDAKMIPQADLPVKD